MIRTAIFFTAAMFCVGAATAQSTQNRQADARNSASQNGQTTEAIPAGAPIEASLSKSIDAKKAKQGEAIEAHVTENTEQNGNILIPRGAKLEGHVTQVSARSNGDSASSVAITFDKALLKKGGEIPLNVSVQAIAISQSAATAPASSNMQPMAGGGAPASGMGRAGAGASGGNTGATNPAPGGAPASVPNSEPTQISGGPGAVGGLNSNGRLAPNSRGVFGLPGIGLSAGTAASQPSAIITSDGKDLHLDSGTQLLLVTRPAATPEAAAH